MVDRSAAVLAVFDGTPGGTQYTLNYAMDQKRVAEATAVQAVQLPGEAGLQRGAAGVGLVQPPGQFVRPLAALPNFPT